MFPQSSVRRTAGGVLKMTEAPPDGTEPRLRFLRTAIFSAAVSTGKQDNYGKIPQTTNVFK